MEKRSLPIYFIRVTTPDEMQLFILAVLRNIGYELTTEFFTHSVAYLTMEGYIVRGTFAINLDATNGRSHYFSTLDDDLVEELQYQEDFQLADLAELCANWKDQCLSSYYSQEYYRLMTDVAYREAKRAGKKLVVGGSVTKPLKKLQNWLLPRVLYCGLFSSGKAPELHTTRLPIAKIFCIEVEKLPARARMVMLSRYQYRYVKSSLKKLSLAVRKIFDKVKIRNTFKGFDRIL